MLFNFNTDEMRFARAALVLYALYKSRNTNSPMNGMETWNRVESYCVGACKKSRTTSEFVTKFKELGRVGAIKPRYLSEQGVGMTILPGGSVVESANILNYHTALIEDNEIRKPLENDYPLITMLVRERIQREKYMLEEEEENEED